MHLIPAELDNLGLGHVFLLHWPSVPTQLIPARLIKREKNVLLPVTEPEELMLEFRAMLPELESRNPFRMQLRPDTYFLPEARKHIFLLTVTD